MLAKFTHHNEHMAAKFPTDAASRPNFYLRRGSLTCSAATAPSPVCIAAGHLVAQSAQIHPDRLVVKILFDMAAAALRAVAAHAEAFGGY